MKRIIIYLIALLPVVVRAQPITHPNISAPQGLAVNSYTGNLFYQHSDLTLRGAAFPVYGAFYYNAATDTVNYGYGHGWSFYYHIFYQEVGSAVVIHRSDARKDTFRLAGAGYTAPAGVYEVLSKSGPGYELTYKNGMKYVFADPAHRKITRMTDVNGNYVQLDYQNGVLTTVRNNDGRALQLGWKNGMLENIQDAALPAKKYTYTYDSKKDLVGITDPLGYTRNFINDRHRIVTCQDERGNPVTIEYHPSGKVKAIRSCSSQQDFSFLPVQRKTILTQSADAGSIVVVYEFDSKGRLVALTDGENHKMQYVYNEQNNVVQTTFPDGTVGRYTYDNYGNLLTGTDPLNQTLRYFYEPSLNRLSGSADKKGQSASFTYDATGNLVKAQYPGNIVMQYEYYGNGKVKTFTNANNKATRYQYNSVGDLTQVDYPIGSVKYGYDGSCCDVSKVTDANGNSLSMTYDKMNRLELVTDDAGNKLTNFYDAAGNLTRETDPNNITKTYGYDELNRLQSVSLLSAGSWHYGYDGVGNLLKRTDANGNTTSYRYNKRNQLIQKTDALGKITRYTYDANGNLTQTKLPNGNTITYRYDALDRLVEKSYLGNSDKYGYDANSNLVSAFNSHIAYSFEYDNQNRLIKKNILTWGKSISYTYDVVGNRKTMTDHDGGVYTYTYDDNNRLTSLKNPYNLTTEFKYDAGGRLEKQTNANNTYTTWHYDAAGHIDLIENKRNDGSTISSFGYSVDKFGNRLSMQDKRGKHTYQYDSSYRLKSVQYGNGDTESFKIDGTGNRTEQTKNGVKTSYSYNAADHLQSAGSSSFLYDANGNAVQQADSVVKQFQYDGQNQLTQVMLPRSKTVQYQYDPFGDKIVRIDTSGVQTRLIYDGDNLLAELNAGNITQVKYTSALHMDSWLGMHASGNNYYYHKDGLNSITELTGSAAQLVNQYSYDVYGNVLSQQTGINNRVMYTGRLWDAGMGLYDYRTRFYMPNTGRFLTEDFFDGKLSAPLSLNKYVYVQNSPVNYIDQTGNFPLLLVFRVVAMAAVRFAVQTGVRGYLFSKTDAHKNRNCGMMQPANQHPDLGADQFSDATGTWQKQEPGKAKFHNFFDDQDPTNKGDWWGKMWDGEDEYAKYRGTKYLRVNADGEYTGEEAIYWSDPDKPHWIKPGDKNGPSWNYGVNPIGYTHVAYDIIPDFFNANYSKNCPPPPAPGTEDPPQPPTDEGPAPDDPTIDIPIVRAVDPNEIVGAPGYLEAKRWMAGQATLPYKIYFENDPEFATAPAQRVTVSMPIDARLNPNSLRIGDFGFGTFNFTVPPNTSIYSTRLDVKDSLGVFVDVTAGLDIQNRRAFWVFQSIDPATGLSTSLPANKGFLLVNDTTTRRGEGYVNLTLLPLSSVATADTVAAQASIIFDEEDTIRTNVWVNTLDVKPPVSSVTSLPNETDSAFSLSWTGNDDNKGVGIRHYDLYVSRNYQPFTLYREKIDSTHIRFTGDPGITYSFFTRATDHTGNQEPMKYKGDDTVAIRLGSTQLATACNNNEVTFATYITGAGNTYQWQVDKGDGFQNLVNDTLYSGVTSTVLTLRKAPTSFYGYRYRSVITNNGITTATAPYLLQFVAYWTGRVSTAWEDAGNWSCGLVPDENTDVVVQTAARYPVVHQHTAIRKLTVDAGTTLTVQKSIVLETKGK